MTILDNCASGSRGFLNQHKKAYFTLNANARDRSLATSNDPNKIIKAGNFRAA